ncbi:Pyridoxamine 5'-phosphate oxidase [Serratia fonticola AU-P3(3)]|nr:Pyridoxamine 5'-phosphate oxidase [Serratia fonticola AU-P3(3)]
MLMDMKTKLAQLQVFSGYAPTPFDTAAAPGTPQELFEQWLDQAIALQVMEPQVMTLSTVDRENMPDARAVVLLDVTTQGWHFAINMRSPKGQQLDHHPYAALTCYWPELAQQIRLRGPVVPLSAEASIADFSRRPVRSRAAILAARQSEILESPRDLETAIQGQLYRLSAEPGLISPYWVLFALAPREVEFWQADSNRHFSRLQYRRDGDDQRWERNLLWP